MDRQPLNDRRLPKNYALVLDIVRTGRRGTHRLASDIYSIACKRQRNVGVATIHRGLNRLSEAK